VEQKINQNKIFLKSKDYAVTGQAFDLCYSSKTGMLVTSPQPSLDALSTYYKSENYISHVKAKKTLFQTIYFSVRAITLRQKLKWVSVHKNKGNRILDYGAGVGDFVRAAQNDGWDCIGIEPHIKARTIANEKKQYTVYPVEHLKTLQPNSQTVITLWHVLEHLHNLEQHIRTFKQLLKPSGRLVVAVPNFKSYDAQYFKSYWAAYDLPRHLWHFSKESISTLFEDFDMEIESIYPMIFDSFYASLVSTKYQMGRMNVLKGLTIGLLSNLKAYFSGEYSSLVFVIKHKNA
jgi:2-polyprenyl-3-methyl-5-hydroxy-6-metoxy-1,4-benzoquinol methylase